MVACWVGVVASVSVVGVVSEFPVVASWDGWVLSVGSFTDWGIWKPWILP